MLFRPFSFDHLQQRLGDVPVKSLEETRVENILIEPEAALYVQNVRKGKYVVRTNMINLGRSQKIKNSRL